MPSPGFNRNNPTYRAIIALLNKSPRWMKPELLGGTLERRPEMMTAVGELGNAAFVEKNPETRKERAKHAAKDYAQAQIRNAIIERGIIPALGKIQNRQFEREELARKGMQKHGPVLKPTGPIRTPEQAAKTLVPKRLPVDKGGIPILGKKMLPVRTRGTGVPVVDVGLAALNAMENPVPFQQMYDRKKPLQAQAGVDEFGQPVPQQPDLSFMPERTPNESTFSYFRKLMGY